MGLLALEQAEQGDLQVLGPLGAAQEGIMSKRNIARGVSTVAVHGTLAALALIAAYLTWTQDKTEVKSVAKPPTVRLIQPQVRNIVRRVGQPSFIESYERTSIYPKLTGYIEKWLFKPGAEVSAGQVLYVLDRRPYEATVTQAKGNLRQSEADLVESIVHTT